MELRKVELQASLLKETNESNQIFLPRRKRLG